MRFVLACALSVSLAACGGRGDARTGQPCRRDNDCAHGLCVAGVAGDEPTCTISCMASDDCPEGWSCTGVTQANVVVCARGGATPFGR